MLTRDKFFEELKKYKAANPSQRYGQAVFNVMYSLVPDLADRRRGTGIDPFHHNVKAALFIDDCFYHIDDMERRNNEN